MRKALLGTSLATAVAAGVGGAAGREGVQGWYRSIRKPRYVPPDAAFPIAWSILYTDIALTSAAAINRFRADGKDGKARAYRAALGANLMLNASFSWVFFNRRQTGRGAIVAGLLAASSADLVRRAADADPKLGVALAPYPLWCGFATVLSVGIWRLNR